MNIKLEAITPDAEKVIADSARTCYQSESKSEPGKLIKALIKSGHHSVLEHASATFRINGVSRAMTHQLVRHRLCSFSQQSQRYVNESQFEYVIPPVINEHPLWKKYFEDDMVIIQKMYDKYKALGVKNEDARFVLPNACTSEIVITANLREWRTIFELRCDKHAQWEIRNVMMHIMTVLHGEAPSVFEDLMLKFFSE